MIEFFVEFDPPRTTQQQHRISTRNGYPILYDGDNLKSAKQLLTVMLSTHRPRTPFNGPVEFTVHWRFRAKSHKDNEWKVSRPDGSNLDKMLEDIMTGLGYWTDDSLIVRKINEKYWSKKPGLYIKIVELPKFKE